jgi:hypothetical protein
MVKSTSEETLQVWARRIQEQKSSGLSARKWCYDHQLRPSQFSYWKNRLTKPISRSSFQEIPNTKRGGITLEYGPVRIHLDGDFEPSTLKRFLLLCKEIPC